MQYQIDAERTEAPITSEMVARFSDPLLIRLDHASAGFTTEAGEFADQLKRHKFYGKSLDRTNLLEEVGDLLWYVALACNALDETIESVQEKNIGKLRVRFPDKFSEVDALDRDLDSERKSLES